MNFSTQHIIKSTGFIFSLLTFLAAAFILTSCSTASGELAESDPPIKKYIILPAELPSKLDFAGEWVPLELLDILESLDRELLINKYWQSQTLLFLKKSKRFFSIIEPILKAHGVPDDFKYLPIAESGFFNSVSPAGAVGIWQFLAGTAREYGLEVNEEVDERYHYEKSTEAACKYLLESSKLYGNWTMAAASYNAGRRGMNRQIDRQDERSYYDLLLNEETARYVFRILSFKLILSDPEKYGFYLAEKDYYPVIPFYEVTIDRSIESFADFSRRYFISYKVLKFMNPWLRDTKLTNRLEKPYYIKIPREGYFRNFEKSQFLQEGEDMMPGYL